MGSWPTVTLAQRRATSLAEKQGALSCRVSRAKANKPSQAFLQGNSVRLRPVSPGLAETICGAVERGVLFCGRISLILCKLEETIRELSVRRADGPKAGYQGGGNGRCDRLLAAFRPPWKQTWTLGMVRPLQERSRWWDG